MKINTIYHSVNERRKERAGDQSIKRYSKDPVHHPFLLEREYVRALNATKVDRLLAKPFISAICVDSEGITRLVKDSSTPYFATASYDNKVALWDFNTRTKISHKTYDQPVSCIAIDNYQNIYAAQHKSVCTEGAEYKIGSIVNGLDYTLCTSGSGDIAVAASNDIQIYDVSRYTPKYTYTTRDTAAVKFNSSFKHIMAGISAMKVSLYDNRSARPFAALDVPGATCAEFNPQQGYILALGNEDGNGYAYDIRNLDQPLATYRGHVNAVVSLAFRPNGREIATGSFDKTIRIFNTESRKSRDCYYNSRMHLVHGVAYSNDGQFIISGSDDGSLRLWKADASAKLGPVSKKEREAMEYKNALKDKYKDVGEIARIARHRFLPNEIKQASKQRHEMYEAALRREARRKAEEENED